jgi:predicted nucleic acid-binding protein
VILVDSGGWYAATCPGDAHFAQARAWLAANAEPLLTTDFIIDETLTLLRARGERRRALQLGEQFFAGEIASIHYLTPVEIAAAWDVFRNYADKDWSFTDCTSKVVLESLGITTAFSFDQHFRQFGSVVVVPATGG